TDDPAFTLTVNGSSFVSTSIIQWNGGARTTSYVSANQLTADILASDLSATGTPTVTVFTPAPGGGTSSGATFTITNPVPAVTTLSPATAGAGGAGFTLTVNGSNFVGASVVQWNGSARATSFVNANQVTATISTNDIASGTTSTVTVFNPSP